jgi:hypothetical protein
MPRFGSLRKLRPGLCLSVVLAAFALPAHALAAPGWSGTVTVVATGNGSSVNGSYSVSNTAIWKFDGTAVETQRDGELTRWSQSATWSATYWRKSVWPLCTAGEVETGKGSGTSPRGGFWIERHVQADGTVTFKLAGNPLSGWTSDVRRFPTFVQPGPGCPGGPYSTSQLACEPAVGPDGNAIVIPADAVSLNSSATVSGPCHSDYDHFTVKWSLSFPARALFKPTWLGDNRELLDGRTSTPSGIGTKIVKWEWRFDDGGTATGSVVTKDFTTPGTHAVTLKVTDDKGKTGSLTKSITVNPPSTYAPYVYFDALETYFPGDAGTFIQGSSLRWERGSISVTQAGQPSTVSCPALQYASTTAINQSWLGGHGGDYWGRDILDPQTLPNVVPTGTICTTLDIDRGPYSAAYLTKPVNDETTEKTDPASNRKHQGFFLDLLPAGSGYSSTLAHGHYSETGPGTYYEYVPGRYIVYWFWYPFNFWESPTAGVHVKEIHEGDWEHIVVRLDGGDNPTAAAYYYHYCAPDVHTWGQLLIPPIGSGSGLFEGTHPIVYSARGGHASYWGTGLAGVHVLESCDGSFQIYDETSAGPGWKTWGGMQDARAQPWYGFGGAWGWGRGKKYLDGTTWVWSVWGPLGPRPDRPATIPIGW